jgi:transcriptional regulator with XRE-family HTH domain
MKNMNVRLLRNEKNWSQEQLAHFSGLSIRTIQRIENNEKVGLESLKSLAAVFEIDLTQSSQSSPKIQESDMTPNLTRNTLINDEVSATAIEPQSIEPSTNVEEAAEKHVAEVKSFYKMLVIYLSTFMLWPVFALVDEGENNDIWWSTLYMGCCYLVIIAIHANSVFQPFGDKWENRQKKKYLDSNK